MCVDDEQDENYVFVDERDVDYMRMYVQDEEDLSYVSVNERDKLNLGYVRVD